MAVKRISRSDSKNRRLSSFARQLMEAWRQMELPVSNVPVIVAVSGGADSVALLLALDELIKAGKLNVELVVAHLNHKIRKASGQDAKWVTQLAKEIGYAANIGARDVTKSKTRTGDNLEQAARKSRYKFLHDVAKKSGANFVVTAHTLDDQAETVLMRLIRGSAAEGLTGAWLVRPIAEGSPIQLARPLLAWARRAETEEYCRLRQIEFRHDEMNDDQTFARVRVRKQLIPMMETFNSRIVEALSRTAALLGEDAAALSEEANRLLEAAAKQNETKVPSLSVDVLRKAPGAVRRRALREWIRRAKGDVRRVEMIHLLAVERLIDGERGGRVAELPGGITVSRRRGRLEFAQKKG